MDKVPFEVAEIPLTELVKNKWNVRRHTDKQRKLLDLSVKELGFIGGILVNKRNMHILDGHLRVQQAMAEGEKTIPCLLIDVDEETEKKILLLLDRVATEGGWHETLYTELLALTKINLRELREEIEQTLNEYKGKVDAKIEKITYMKPNLNYVVLVFRDDTNWLTAMDVFNVHTIVSLKHKKPHKVCSFPIRD